MATYFTLGDSNRTRRDWGILARKTISTVATPDAAAKLWAKLNGAAGIWNADGSLTVFYQDFGKIRRRTFKDCRPA